MRDCVNNTEKETSHGAVIISKTYHIFGVISLIFLLLEILFLRLKEMTR